jgi:dual specificity phosphatase 12
MPPKRKTPQQARSLEAAKQQALELDQISEVVPGVSIGSYAVADCPEALEAAGITHVVCLCDDLPEPAQDLVSLHLPMSDSGDSDLEGLTRKALEFIRGGIKVRGRVLVFCGLGVNRSPAMVSAYLVIDGWSLDDALRAVYNARPMASLHENYLAKLRALALRNT